MYKRYSVPEDVLNNMSWDKIPGFIERLAEETQKEQLYEFWVQHYQFIQEPFDSFIDTNDNQLHSEERKKEIRRREAKSNWNLTEIT